MRTLLLSGACCIHGLSLMSKSATVPVLTDVSGWAFFTWHILTHISSASDGHALQVHTHACMLICRGDSAALRLAAEPIWHELLAVTPMSMATEGTMRCPS